jgi:large subunit ribosomal protein L13
MQKTYLAKPGEIEAKWWVVDAEDKVLGRIAREIAVRLMGKHKPTYTPFLDTGDNVIVINASKVVLTGRKLDQKMYRYHSGYPGGLREVSAGKLLARRPGRLIEEAVWGMLPKGRLGRRVFKKLKVYAGSEHPHAAQQPQTFQITQVAQ